MQRVFRLLLISALSMLFLTAGHASFNEGSGKRGCSEETDLTRISKLNSRNYLRHYNKSQRHKCKKEWTVLVYMQGDNNLEPYAYWDLHEMEALVKGDGSAASSIRSDVVVQFDSLKERTINRYHMMESQQIYKSNATIDSFIDSTFKSITSPQVGTISENSDKQQAQYLREFVRWGIDKYPANNYMLIIWGHGEGWTSQRLAQFGGLALDSTDDQKISITDLSSVLADIESITSKKLDVLLTDACLMQTIEVVSEIAPYTRFTIGSTQIQNFRGQPYRNVFTQLNSGKYNDQNLGLKDEGHRLAMMIPDLFLDSYQFLVDRDILPQNEFNNLTMSSVSSSFLEGDFYSELSKVAILLSELVEFSSTNKNLIKKAISDTPSFLGSSRDFGTLIASIQSQLHEKKSLDFAGSPILSFMVNHISHSSVNSIREYVRAQLNSYEESNHDEILSALVVDYLNLFKKELNQLVLNYSFGPQYYLNSDLNYFLGYFRAFGIWIPENRFEYTQRMSDFNQSKLYQETQWDEFIDTIYKTDIPDLQF